MPAVVTSVNVIDAFVGSVGSLDQSHWRMFSGGSGSMVCFPSGDSPMTAWRSSADRRVHGSGTPTRESPSEGAAVESGACVSAGAVVSDALAAVVFAAADVV